MRRLLSGLAVAIASLGPASAAAPEIAITFDDLPAHSALPTGETRLEIAQKIIAALKAANVPPVYGFVNGVQLEREPASAAVLPAWRAAGFPLGNHTWSHPNLDAMTAVQFEREIARNEPILASQAGATDWHWLRYPFLSEGSDPTKRAAVRAWLAAHHYRIAAVTTSFGDYAWNEPYARCVAKGDTAAIAALKASYLKSARDSIPYTRALSHALYGRDIPYVLLMHIGALDAELLPQVLDIYRASGFRFVSLAEAERDPAYAADLDPSRPARPGSLEGRLAERHLSVPSEPNDMVGLDSVCR